MSMAQWANCFWECRDIGPCILLWSAMGMTHILGKDLWWVMRTANVHWCWLKHQSSFNRTLGPLSDTLQAGAWLFPPFSRKWPDHVGKFKLTHVASLQFLPLGQYRLCFGYCFSGPLPLRSHKGQVTFLEPFPGVPSRLDYTQKLAKPS